MRVLDNLSLFVLVALVALRPLISESYDSAGSGFGAAVTGIADPSPVTTLAIDLLILLAAFGTFLGRAISKVRAYQWSGIEVGMGIALIGAVVSCFFASNQRLAINATIDWFCFPIATIALVQLLRAKWQRQVLILFVLASSGVQMWAVLDYDSGETWEVYQQGKEKFWESQGVALDSATVELYERRLQADEAQGYFPHSNVASAYLVMCCVVAIGLAVAAWRAVAAGGGVAGAVLMSGLVFALLWATWLTRSLGGYVSLGLGIALLAAIRRWRGWIDANRWKVLKVGWGAFGVGAVALIGHGLYHGSLPLSTLNFRWQYWTASAEMVSDNIWTGVGRENFGREYLRYKSIESPEEVANPHNFFVQAACDWGILGLVGVAGMCVGATVVLARRRDTGWDDAPRDGPGSEDGLTPARLLLWGVGGLLVVTVGRVGLLGSDDANWVYYQTVMAGLVWALSFGVAAAGMRAVDRASGDGAGKHWEVCVAVALLTLVVHELINFALFVPGSAYAFFALLGCGLAGRGRRLEEASEADRAIRWACVGDAGIAMGLVVWFGLIPAARAERAMVAGRNAPHMVKVDELARHPAAQLLVEAAETDPFDPTPLVERAEFMMRAAGIEAWRKGALLEAERSLEGAIERDPRNVQLYRMQMRLALERGRAGEAGVFEEALMAGIEVLMLYPESPKDLVSLGDALVEAGRALSRDELLGDAVSNYEQAIALDDQRPAWEKFRRFRAGERADVLRKLEFARVKVAPIGDE